MTNGERVAVLKDLAEACSIQAKIENRIWLGAIAAAFVVLLPHQQAAVPGGDAVAQLPFGLGEAPAPVIYPLAFAILAIFVVALAAAHAQHVRADKLAHELIDHMSDDSASLPGGVRPRDFFDLLREPSLTRVAPLAQWLRGRWQFEAERAPCPLWRRIASTGLYVALKLVVLLVLFATPGVALHLGYQQVIASGISRGWLWLLGAAGIIAAISLLLVTVADVLGTWLRVKKLARAGPAPLTWT